MDLHLLADETLRPETEYEISSKPIKDNINRYFDPMESILENYFGPGPKEKLYEKIALADILQNLSILNEALELTKYYRKIVRHMIHGSHARHYMNPNTDKDLEPLLNELDLELNVYGSNINKGEGKKMKTKKRRKGRKAVRLQRPVNKVATRVSKLRARQFPRGKKKTYKKK